MDEVFNNIIYFIPVALIIAFRVINAKNKQEKKQQQQKPFSAGPEPERTALPQLVPEWPSSVRPAVQKPAVKKPAARKTAKPQQQSGYKSVFPETEKVTQTAAAQDLAPVTGAVRSVADRTAAAEPAVLPAVRPGLTPLQQALVWSEILGTPRAEQS